MGMIFIPSLYILAYKCFLLEEDDFVDLLIEKYEEKKKYVDYLEAEGSILAESYRDKSQLFRVRNVTGDEMDWCKTLSSEAVASIKQLN